MDNQRPELDLKFYKDICPDQNGASLKTFVTVFNAAEVPVIVVFTKYDQFLRNVKMQMLDYPKDYPDLDPDNYSDSNVSEAAEKTFQEHYLHPLGDEVRYVRLESGYVIKCQGYRLMFVGRNA
jgi:hypothetical protein